MLVALERGGSHFPPTGRVGNPAVETGVVRADFLLREDGSSEAVLRRSCKSYEVSSQNQISEALNPGSRGVAQNGIEDPTTACLSTKIRNRHAQ